MLVKYVYPGKMKELLEHPLNNVLVAEHITHQLKDAIVIAIIQNYQLIVHIKINGQENVVLITDLQPVIKDLTKLQTMKECVQAAKLELIAL